MRADRRAGFTLVELLVAITVLAMVAVLGWRGLDSILRSRIAITDEIEETRGMQLTFAQLESDCAHVASPSLVARRPTLLAQDDRLLLARTVFAEGEPTRVQIVTYRLIDGQLTRQESVPSRDLDLLDASWREALDATAARGAIVLQSGVSGMSVRTWTSDRRGWRAANGAMQVSAAGNVAAITVDGLEVALELQRRPGKLVKIFLLGSA